MFESVLQVSVRQEEVEQLLAAAEVLGVVGLLQGAGGAARGQQIIYCAFFLGKFEYDK